MSSSVLQIQCSNPTCMHAENPLGRQVCDRCQTPLEYRYLWAVGQDANQIPVGTVVGGRYGVASPQIWLDTQPAQPPDAPLDLPDAALPYLYLYPHRLHLPGLYSLYSQGNDLPPILLLDNSPISTTGQPLPDIGSRWSIATPVRQVYWLWQLLQLWQPLQQHNVTRSVLVRDNLRVEGWRVRLRELLEDEADRPAASLADLADCWQPWIEKAHPQIATPLGEIWQQMRSIADSSTDIAPIATQLNHLLLQQAAQLPLTLKIAGASVTGPQRSHNEDVCYPDQYQFSAADPLLPLVGIVCDGIGGHEGGEVASQLAVRSLQPLLRALFLECAEEEELLSPDVIQQQLVEIVRVVNNQISAQNDAQKRELQQRMGTTLVMAVQISQKLPDAPSGNTHELYLVHVGDSRAYWLTAYGCQQLTVDDDVAAREVRTGRSLYQVALQRPDAGALVQAIGTHDADRLRVSVQRFILEEDGLLLLCSDGLSDYGRVEHNWQTLTQETLKGKSSLSQAVDTWIDVANQQNGHDNTSVVLLHCQVSPVSYAGTSPTAAEPQVLPEGTIAPEAEFTESARVLLEETEAESDQDMPAYASPQARLPLSPGKILVGLAVALLILGSGGIAWRQLDPIGFQQTWQRVFGSPEQ